MIVIVVMMVVMMMMMIMNHVLLRAVPHQSLLCEVESALHDSIRSADECEDGAVGGGTRINVEHRAPGSLTHSDDESYQDWEYTI